ncbi:MAG: DUF2764 family protein [Sphaerochaetaceae bacterium]
MASYYYLVASLPALGYDKQPSLSVEGFLSQCKANMGPRDYHLIECAISGESVGNSFLLRYQRFCQMVKSELSEQRARKLSLPLEKYKNNGPKSYVISDAVRMAISNENVLSGEMILIVLKWKYLDEMCAQHVFDIEALLSYALKLSLITRKNLFSQEAGNVEFRRLFSNLQSDISSI